MTAGRKVRESLRSTEMSDYFSLHCKSRDRRAVQCGAVRARYLSVGDGAEAETNLCALSIQSINSISLAAAH